MQLSWSEVIKAEAAWLGTLQPEPDENVDRQTRYYDTRARLEAFIVLRSAMNKYRESAGAAPAGLRASFRAALQDDIRLRFSAQHNLAQYFDVAVTGSIETIKEKKEAFEKDLDRYAAEASADFPDYRVFTALGEGEAKWGATSLKQAAKLAASRRPVLDPDTAEGPDIADVLGAQQARRDQMALLRQDKSAP